MGRWDKELEVAREAVTAACAVIMRHFGKEGETHRKGEGDLVTEADLEAEASVLGILHARFPGDAVLSEEAGAKGPESARVWLVDPLDGTVNFAHGFPFFAVSVALYVQGEGVVGIVDAPYLGERFEAVQGLGATLNGRPLTVSRVRDLRESLVATGFPSAVRKHPEAVLDAFGRMLRQAQGIRRPGSAALDLAYVAAGRLEGFWENGLSPWDSAAGALIVMEAGGVVTTCAGDPFDPYLGSLLAANSPQVHAQMLLVLAA